MHKARGRLPPKGAQKQAAEKNQGTPLGGSQFAAAGKTVIPVTAETLKIGKRVIDTGRAIRVIKTVREQEHVVDEPLNQDELQVERVAINRFFEASELPSIRQEDDVTVVPILEEVLVTEKRLLLKEEVRTTRVRRQIRQPQRVVLRSEQVSVEHFDETADQSAQAHRVRSGNQPVETTDRSFHGYSSRSVRCEAGRATGARGIVVRRNCNQPSADHVLRQ